MKLRRHLAATYLTGACVALGPAIRSETEACASNHPPRSRVASSSIVSRAMTLGRAATTFADG
jgi:hypothetical protein